MTVGGAQLRRELTSLGVPRGAVLLVHCSLSAIGWVEGGATTLLSALLDVLGEDGTLAVPTQSSSKSMTSTVFRTAVAELSARKREMYLDSLTGFDPASTPSEGMGALAEAVRTHARASRSAHPTVSFAAIGRRAAELTSSHPYDCLLGEDSPLGWMSREKARVLLLGVGYDTCTAFHLGEDRSVSLRRSYQFKIKNSWQEIHDARDYDDSDFTELGVQFEALHKNEVKIGFVGAAPSRLFFLDQAADFAAEWMPMTRQRDGVPLRETP